MTDLQLRKDQIDVLQEYERLGGADADVVLHDAETIDAVKDVLAGAIRETTGLRNPEALDLDALALQLTDEDADEVRDMLAAPGSQQPETGGVDPEDDADNTDEDVAVGDLLTRADDDVIATLSKADRWRANDRLPNRSEELVAEAADALGVEPDDIDLDDPDVAEHVPSDPRRALR